MFQDLTNNKYVEFLDEHGRLGNTQEILFS